MNILILGSGMYVTGRGQSKTGTILASVLQSSKNVSIASVHIVSYSASSEQHTLESANYTNEILGTNVAVTFDCLENKNHNWLTTLIQNESYHLCINSLPDHLHFHFAKITLSQKIPTLIVKPLTPTYREGLELKEIADKFGVYCAVEFHKRWDESNLYLKQGISDLKYGAPLYFDVNYSQRIIIPSEQFKSWAAKTNIFQYLGVHYVDLIYFMTGKMPKKLSTYGTKKKLVSLGIDTWDSVHVSSVWGDEDDDSNDFYAHFNLNWIDSNNTSAMSDQRISFVGTEGRVDCNQKNRGIEEVTNTSGVQSINPYFSSWLSDGNFQKLNGYGFQSIHHFIMDIHQLINKEVSIEQLNIKRPGIDQSLISTKFIDVVTQQLHKNHTGEVDIWKSLLDKN